MSTKKTKPAAAEANAEPAAATTAESATRATKPSRGGKTRKPGKDFGKAAKPRQKAAVTDGGAKAARTSRADTKQAKLVAMLRTKDGATVEEIAKAFGWQSHTVRGSLYGALRKKLGLDIVSEKVEGRGRVYRIGS